MKKHKLTLGLIALILMTDVLESIYEFFFKKGMLLAGEVDFSSLSAFGDFAGRALSNGWIWTGLIIIILETFTWFIIVSKIDLSLAFPVGSMRYIFIVLISAFFLHENVSLNRWIGTFIIVAGISLVAVSSHEKYNKPKKT
ncbi:MAG: EamA family transporter [Candidatus Omnitrophica bacterium]|nr:EamA family transporter [Candidatus Omnitrophota bacterium]